ncbi:MAG TPA: alkyl sulfatase dimerization domain-containing protein [Dehalococcoidia bacterium]|nr:alkyl sulfatase dimerization domain-containing protein [Dehalococcoidia bacterium]
MPDIRDLAERLWTGTLDSSEAHPVTAQYREGDEILPGVLFYKGFASANTIDTGDALVMLDTGAVTDTQALYESVRKWRPEKRLQAAVFSHHHVDHIFGVGPFEREADEKKLPRPLVYGHAALVPNFERYKKTLGWNTAINIRQFAFPMRRPVTGDQQGRVFSWPEQYRYPDVAYQERMTFRSGDLTFELHHARGETDDATWTWIPERKIVAPGDLFIWASPNAGNPQKVQRYCGEWAAALREMSALGAETLIPGHGLPVFGADRIRQALDDTAELLESLEAQTLALMNAGATLDRVLHEVTMPQHLLDKPYLRPVYDHPQFILRNIWRLYGGWHDGEPDNLLPAPRAEQAREWVALAGGVGKVLDRVRQLRDEDNLRLACHLVEYAVLAEPSNADVHALRAEVYGARSQRQSSSMARNILNHAALASAEGKRDLAGEA